MRTVVQRALLILALALITLSGSRAWAAPLEVNTTVDVIDSDDGLCSLREAVLAAENDTASGLVAGECTDPDTNFDTIHLPASATPYTLTIPGPDTSGQHLPEMGDLDLSKDLTLLGDGSSTTTINANGTVTMDRVFDIFDGNIAISGVTLQSGVGSGSGGGIVISAGQAPVVTLTDVVVTGNKTTGTNSGGGIFN